MTESPSHYVHGTDAEEQRRLTRMNRLLNETSVREIAPRSGERVLDVGSGLGQLTRALARAAGARAVGIERSEAQIAEAMRQAEVDGETALLDLRRGDVGAFPLRDDEWGGFDLAHARFLLEHVPDPLAVVRQMVRAVRPGGRIVLEDDDHDVLRLWPEPPSLARAWKAYMATYPRAGNDPDMGRKLVQLLAEAGATPSRNTWIFFGGCSGDPDFPDYVANLSGVLEGARAAMVASGDVRGEDLDAALDEIRAFGARSDAAIWYARSWAEGRKP